LGVDFRSLGGPYISNFQQIPRTADRQPADSGQYGLNLKLYLPNFSGGTELGLYFLNYHSRLPVVSFRTGTQAGVANAFGALTAVGRCCAGACSRAALRSCDFDGRTGRSCGCSQGRRQPQRCCGAAVCTIGANTLLAGGNVTRRRPTLHQHLSLFPYSSHYPALP